MAKSGVSTSIQGVQNNEVQANALSHHEFYDDSPLPPPEDLERYQKLDSTILEWIKKRAEKEQEARLEMEKRQMTLNEEDFKLTKYLSKYTLWLAFILAIIFIGSTLTLLVLGIGLGASIFGGLTVLIIIIISFLNYSKITKRQEE